MIPLTPFRRRHCLTLLGLLPSSPLPLDTEMSNYFRAHKAVGSKDRLAISTTIYALIRWQGALDILLAQPITWEKRLDTFEKGNLQTIVDDPSLPLHIRCSFPKTLFQKIAAAYGEKKAFSICLTLNERAPLCLRVNTLLTTRDKLMEALPLSLKRGEYPTALIVEGRANLFSLAEFKAGYFECQDEGSQIMAGLVHAKPGDHVLDYCSGSGGKTLAIAPALHGKGQLYLHDIRPTALMQAKNRLKRAGITNAQIAESPARLRGRMDHILVDAPCSGTGTLRRNPDLKWKFDLAALERLVQTQRQIFAEALPCLKESGQITYVTCSLLPEENEAQVKAFLETYPLELVKEPTQLLPLSGGHDGFFGATFRKKSPPMR